MGKIIITAIVLLVVLMGIVLVLDNIKVQTSPTPVPSEVASISATPSFDGAGIKVSEPEAGDEVSLPLVIKGEARTFEAAFSYRVKNSKGTALVEGHGMTTGTADPPAFRPFEVTVNYPDPKTASGSVEVFEYSAKDGSEINKVIVPVKFKQNVQAINVKLYLDITKPIDWRIPKTDTPVRATLDELLKVADMTVAINSVILKSGALTVDLNGTVDAKAVSQITKTALQFSNVTKVVITVNGKAL